MRKLLTTFTVLLATACVAFAQNFSEPQRNAMEKIAQAFAGVQVCTRYVINERMVNLIGIRFNMPISDPAVMKYVEERAIFHRKRIQGRSEDDICGAMTRLYGPEGTDAKGLVVPKR